MTIGKNVLFVVWLTFVISSFPPMLRPLHRLHFALGSLFYEKHHPERGKCKGPARSEGSRGGNAKQFYGPAVVHGSLRSFGILRAAAHSIASLWMTGLRKEARSVALRLS